jgi:hypothetical protein
MPLAMSLIFTAIGFMLVASRLEWRLRAQRVEGTIVGVEEGGKDSESGRPMYSTVYQYRDALGRTIQTTERGASTGLRRNRTGREVSLLVAPNDPKDAREANSVVIELLGAVFFGIGVWQLSLARPEWYPQGILLFVTGLALVYAAASWYSHSRSMSHVGGSGDPLADAFNSTTPVLRAEDLLAMPEGRRATRNARLFSPLLILLGAAFIAGAGYMGRDMLRLESAGLRAPGTVVRLIPRSGRGGTVYDTAVRFTPAGGHGAIEFVNGDGTNPPSHRVGDAVRVLYADGSGAAAIIDRGIFNWLMPLVFGGSGVLCVIWGFSMLFRRSPRNDLFELSPALSSIPASDGLAAAASARVVTAPTLATARAPAATANSATAAPSSVFEKMLAHGHFKRWVVALFVIDAVLVFSPPSHKTGYAAFGAIIFTFVSVLAVFTAIISIIANALFMILGVAGAVKGRAKGNDFAASSDSYTPHSLVSRYSRMQQALWKTALALTIGSIVMLVIGEAARMINGDQEAFQPQPVAVAPRQPAAASRNVAVSNAFPVDFSPLLAGKLTIWFSRSSGAGGGQPGTLRELQQDFPNTQINGRNIEPSTLVAEWQGASADTMPDVAFIDNFAQLNALLSQEAVWRMWASGNRFGLNGWWVISKRTPHVEAARALLRWLAVSPRWRPIPVRNDRLSSTDITMIESNALAAAAALKPALRSGERGPVEDLLDPNAARAMDDLTYEGLQVISAKPLKTFGNSRLAFTIVAVEGSSDRFYGLRHMAFIFRKSGDEWRILYLNRDTTLRQAESLFRGFDFYIRADGPLPPVPAPVLTEPADNANLPVPESRHPELAWTMAASTVASFLIETQMNVGHMRAPPPIDTRDLTDSFLSFSNPAADQQSYRISAPFGVNAQPYRVRIWAMDPSGQLSFSAWHAMYFLDPAGAPGHEGIVSGEGPAARTPRAAAPGPSQNK